MNGKKEAAGSRGKEKIRANVKKRKSKRASRRVGRTKREREKSVRERKRKRDDNFAEESRRAHAGRGLI